MVRTCVSKSSSSCHCCCFFDLGFVLFGAFDSDWAGLFLILLNYRLIRHWDRWACGFCFGDAWARCFAELLGLTKIIAF